MKNGSIPENASVGRGRLGFRGPPLKLEAKRERCGESELRLRVFEGSWRVPEQPGPRRAGERQSITQTRESSAERAGRQRERDGRNRKEANEKWGGREVEGRFHAAPIFP